jgi:hypothetical protein
MPAVHRRSLLKVVLGAAGAVANLFIVRLSRAQGMMGGMMGGGTGGMMGDGMMGGMGGMMGPMRTGMQLFRHHSEIHRNVTFLPDGVRAVTESDNPEVAALIQEHVGEMYTRIDQDRPFAYPMSRTVPVLFRNIGRYRRQLEITPRGVAITETALDADMIELIKAHAREISGFVAEGMPAMMRDMMR